MLLYGIIFVPCKIEFIVYEIGIFTFVFFYCGILANKYMNYNIYYILYFDNLSVNSYAKIE